MTASLLRSVIYAPRCRQASTVEVGPTRLDPTRLRPDWQRVAATRCTGRRLVREREPRTAIRAATEPNRTELT